MPNRCWNFLMAAQSAADCAAVDRDRAEAAELLEVPLDLLLELTRRARGRGLGHDGGARHGGDRRAGLDRGARRRRQRGHPQRAADEHRQPRGGEAYETPLPSQLVLPRKCVRTSKHTGVRGGATPTTVARNR
jgi:hypothetical protein